MKVKFWRISVSAEIESGQLIQASKLFTELELQSRMDNGETAIALEAQDQYKRVREIAEG